MDKIKSSWTEETFKAYLMVYAAQSDQIETEEEKYYLESHFDPLLLKGVYKEINSDNDYQRIQKIMLFVEKNNFSKEDLKKILDEIKEMYMCDGSFDAPEQMIFSVLQKLFKIN